MPPALPGVIPPASRKTLLDWIDNDDGHTTGTTQPACSAAVQALHAQILLPAGGGRRGNAEPLEPPPGLRLAPLG